MPEYQVLFNGNKPADRLLAVCFKHPGNHTGHFVYRMIYVGDGGITAYRKT